MSSSSYASSLSPESMRSSILRRMIPKGFHLVPDQSDTNSTMTNIRGPGRVVGSMLSSAGKRFERAVDRFAEEQLGLGPNVAALRLTSVLHDIHVRESPKCPSDHNAEISTSLHVTDRLIWACNGFCSHCHTPYLPKVLTELPESALRVIGQLMKYLQPSQPPSNIGLASVFIRILIQSHVLAVSLVQRLDFLGVMQSTRETVWPSYTSRVIFLESLVAVKSTIAAIQEIIEIGTLNVSYPLMRFDHGEGSYTEKSFLMLLDQFEQISIGDWALKEIVFAQLLTKVFTIGWNLAIHTKVSELKRLLKFITQVRLSPQIPNYLVARITKPLVQATAASSGSTALSLLGHKSIVWSVAWSSDRTKIISGSTDRTVCIWDARTGRQRVILKGHTNQVNSVTFSPNNAMLASGADDASVRLWDVETSNLIAVLEGHTAHVWSMAFSPDGALIASGSGDETIRLWDVKTGLESSILRGHTNCVKSVAFSPNGTLLVSGSDDKSVRLWELRNGQQISYLSGHSLGVRSVAFSPDCGYIVSGSEDRTIRVWDVRTGRKTATLNGHNDWVTSVDFAPDGMSLVSGSYDETVRLWDVKIGDQIAVLHGHSNWVTSVKFSLDGNYIASGSWDETIRVWDVSILRAAHGGSGPPLGAQTEEVELGDIPEESELEPDSGEWGS